MQVVFRTDASQQIGTGHVMRCLVLAQELRDRGALCKFVCRDHVGHLGDYIKNAGFEVVLLSQVDGSGAQDDSSLQHSEWLGIDWYSDAQQFTAASGPMPIDLLVVDHYALDLRWEFAVRSCCKLMAVIDDLADRPHVCDVLLDQNPGRHPSDYHDLVPGSCNTLAGPKYALLRREFASWRPRSLLRSRSFPPSEVVVSLGGVDACNVTCAALCALDASPLPLTTRFTAILGIGFTHLASVRSLVQNMRHATRIEVVTNRMAELLAASDLVIGAAGTSALERCCLGVPSLCVVLAANQQAGASALQAHGAVMKVPVQAGALEAALTALLRHAQPQDFLRRMQEAAQSLTDGLGARRVADALLI